MSSQNTPREVFASQTGKQKFGVPDEFVFPTGDANQPGSGSFQNLATQASRSVIWLSRKGGAVEKIVPKGILVGLCSFLLFASSGAQAYRVSVDFTAQVSGIMDHWGYLSGRIGIGDIFSGTYSYETETPDTNSLPDVGDYRHDSPPYGVSFDINGYGFRTNPDAVDFLLELGNDRGLAKYDFYLFHSYNNLFDLAVPPLPEFPDIPPINTVSFYLFDSAGTALSDTEIPLQAPVLANWGGRNYMNISSQTGVFSGEYFYDMQAELLSVAPSAAIPEPSSMLLFASGIACLLGYRRYGRSRSFRWPL